LKWTPRRTPREDTPWTVLIDAVFQFIGEWTQDPESLIRPDGKAPALPGESLNPNTLSASTLA
jgi:hypothetical protein